MNTLTSEQWTRINQVHELVKQEGDATCEAAFDDLIGHVNALRTELTLEQAFSRTHGHTGCRAAWHRVKALEAALIKRGCHAPVKPECQKCEPLLASRLKAKFRHDSGFEIEIEAHTEDLHLLPEVAVRKAFLEEASRRLGTVILGEWELIEITESHP